MGDPRVRFLRQLGLVAIILAGSFAISAQSSQSGSSSGSGQAQNQGSSQPGEKQQGLTREDEEKIRKALNPPQAPTSVPGHPNVRKLPCPECDSAWQEVLSYARDEAHDPHYTGATEHFYKQYLACVKKHCPELNQEPQTNTCPGGQCTPCEPGQHCESPQSNTCPGGHCTPCEPGQHCESPQSNTCPGGQCTPCEPGQHCESPQTNTCPGGQCTPCEPGQHCESPQTNTCPGGQCTPCEPGKHCESPQTGACLGGQCTPCTSDQPCPSQSDIDTILMQAIKESVARSKQSQPSSPGPSSTPPPMTASIVGVVTPVHRQKDQPFSGTITTDPSQYQGIPGLEVQQVNLQLVVGSDGKPTLQNMTVDTGKGVLQTTDQANSVFVYPQANISQPGGQPALQPGQPPVGAPGPSVIKLQTSGGPPVTVGLDVQPVVQPTRPVEGSSAYQNLIKELRMGEVVTSPVCLPGHITAVHGAGQFSGDARKLMVAFDGHPLQPIAASTDGFFVRIPLQHDGPGQLVIADKGRNNDWFALAATVAVVQLRTGIANPNLHRGLRTTGTVGLSGSTGKSWFMESVRGEDWRRTVTITTPYDPELVNLAEIQKQVPDFHPPEKGKPGFVLLSIMNRTPGIISIDGFKGNVRSWNLPAGSLPFNTELRITAINDGAFDIGIIAQPLFPFVSFRRYQIPPQLVDELEAKSRW